MMIVSGVFLTTRRTVQCDMTDDAETVIFKADRRLVCLGGH
jgi:hypothetical protein